MFFQYSGYVDSLGYINSSDITINRFQFDETGHVHKDWRNALPHKSLFTLHIRESVHDTYNYEDLLINTTIHTTQLYGIMLDREL
jgi:hypothetical protein